MNKAKFVRYRKGNSLRAIASETGQTDRFGIGIARDTEAETWALSLSFVAPDGRDTQLMIHDLDTLKRLVNIANKLIVEKEIK